MQHLKKGLWCWKAWGAFFSLAPLEKLKVSASYAQWNIPDGIPRKHTRLPCFGDNEEETCCMDWKCGIVLGNATHARFPSHHCRAALKRSGKSVEAATEFLLSNTPDQLDLMAAEDLPAPAAAPAVSLHFPATFFDLIVSFFHDNIVETLCIHHSKVAKRSWIQAIVQCVVQSKFPKFNL